MIVLYIILFISLLLLVLYLRFNNSVIDIKKLGSSGSMYYGFYKKNYNNFLIRKVFKFMRGSQCSAFMVKDDNGHILTGRNYDMPHMDKDNNCQGLNMVLRLKPQGKYQSINGVDVSWLTLMKLPYYRNAFDNKKLFKLPLAFLPYLTMDGINQKGLTVSILALDTKENEKAVYQNEKGKPQLTINEVVRELLDNCADVKQSIDYLNKINLVNLFNYDYHLFITDRLGNCIISEWRYNKLTITKQDCCTNYYVGYKDGIDCYYGDVLKEKITKLNNSKRVYCYGYGHGYQRFNIMAAELEKHLENDVAIMNKTQCMKLLSEVAQNYNGEITSFTQYSVVYDSSDLTAKYCCQQNYQEEFEFKI